MVQEKLSLPAAWAAQLPADTDLLARLAPLDDDGTTVVHPLGALETRQHVLPLETVVNHVGANPVDVSRVNLGAPLLTAAGAPPVQAKAISNATDLFSPGNFLTLSEDQKLSRPAFEPFPAGMVIAAQTSLYGTPSGTAYEWCTVCPPVRTAPRRRFTSMAGHTKRCWPRDRPGRLT